MSKLRIERYAPDLNEWMDITDYALRRFPLEAKSSYDRVAEQYARIYEMDIRVIKIETQVIFKGARGV